MRQKIMVHIGGAPGSGKSRMARSLVDQLAQHDDIKAEHISIGNTVRAIGRGAIESTLEGYIRWHISDEMTAHQPLEDSAVLDILTSNLDIAIHRGADMVLLDGFPRYQNQVSHYFEQAELYGYDTPGALIAAVDHETALARQIKRSRNNHDRIMTPQSAINRLELHNQTYPDTLDEFANEHPDFRVHTIYTTGPKSYTDRVAYQALKNLLEF